MPSTDHQALSKNTISEWMEHLITEFSLNSPENTLDPDGREPAWERPLTGFSRGDDPLYREIKEDIGSFYLTPAEAFKMAFPKGKVRAGDLTVISWILPQTRATRADNRKENLYPSQRWARAYKYGEAFNRRLRGHVVKELNRAGFRAVSPMLEPFWSIRDSDKYGRSSNWSERHAAHVSGLGTFGLCDGLITEKGKAMRCGSVVAEVSIPPTHRPYANPYAFCLYLTQGKCGKCMNRCPAGAITPQGHDKVKCRAYLYGPAMDHVKTCYGFELDVCGLCQTGVPCEARIPLPGK